MATCRVCSATLTSNPAEVNGSYGEDGSGKTLLESQVSKAIGESLCTYHWMQVLEGNDNTAIASVVATKEIFAFVSSGNPAVGSQGVQIDGVGQYANTFTLIPHDFTSLTSLEVIFRPWGTGASMHFGITTRYGAYNGGEDYNAHTEVVAGRDIGATVNIQYLAHDISDLVDIAALAVGDLLRVNVLYDATAIDSNAFVLGSRLRYD